MYLPAEKSPRPLRCYETKFSTTLARLTAGGDFLYASKHSPRATLSMMFFSAYVLESIKDGKRYIGYTAHLRRRLEEHQHGLSFATKTRLPMKLIYGEICTNQIDALRREHYLKSTRGGRFLAKRLIAYYQSKV